MKEGLSLNEQYNTRNAVSSIPDEIFRKIRSKRASRKYNKCRSYIYFWKARWDGTVESLAEQSKRPHHHPNEHTPDELKLIRDMRWHRLRKRGYTRRVESLYRVLKRLALLPQAPAKPTYKPKHYEQITYPGERVQNRCQICSYGLPRQ